ncbi:hypothetical protein FGO68_gene42 [Halteria grandinella]|uniref:Uncharacterized protein n=1 Tax=Halteria grandinella TaxID=5974 RepID=A0A8J8TAS1_HALGN|nr:hypothetical protein FGO68_gene42 [Halteria grandinella]
MGRPKVAVRTQQCTGLSQQADFYLGLRTGTQKRLFNQVFKLCATNFLFIDQFENCIGQRLYAKPLLKHGFELLIEKQYLSFLAHQSYRIRYLVNQLKGQLLCLSICGSYNVFLFVHLLKEGKCHNVNGKGPAHFTKDRRRKEHKGDWTFFRGLSWIERRQAEGEGVHQKDRLDKREHKEVEPT